MNTEMIIKQIELDFESMAKEHDGTAENEYIWALGAPDAETTRMHSENMDQHKFIARMYRRMKTDGLAFIETYDDEANF